MGEAKQACPVCGRLPGTQHYEFCSRAAKRFRERKVREPEFVYPGKGLFKASDGKKEVRALNPGIPRVRAPKPRTAGGTPRGSAVTWWTGTISKATGSKVIQRADAAAVAEATQEFLTGRLREMGR